MYSKLFLMITIFSSAVEVLWEVDPYTRCGGCCASLS